MLETIVLRVGAVSLTCSAVLLPLLLLTRWLHNRYAARTRYFLWLLLALRLALPFQLTLPTPAVTVEAPSPAITIPSAWNTAANAPQAQPSPPSATGPAAPSAAPVVPAARSIPLMEILGAVWLTGAAVCGGFYLLSYAAARRRLLSRAAPAGEEETAWLRHLAGKTGCRRAARLYWSEDVRSPMILGLARPVILLPDCSIGEEELTIVLRHELTHLKRGDIAYKLLLLAANCVHWFNPLVWWMAREAAHNLELCCDDDVVRHRGEEFRRLYGEILLRTAQTPGPTPALSTRFGSGKAQMKERLINMFQHKKNSALLVCLVFVAALLSGSLVACESAKASSPGRISEEEAFDLLEESITYEQGALSFTVPNADTPSDPWYIYVAGRLEYPDGFSSSIHYFTTTDWVRGKTYSEQIGESAPYFTELFLDMELGEQQRSVDLLPYIQSTKDLLYIDLERGFTLQLPSEWADLVEMENASEDASVLVLYHSAGRREDDSTAGVLATLCVTTVDGFNEFYGDKDLDGMYEYGGLRIWVLGTVGEYLIYLHVDPLPDGYAGQSEEFALLHQQLEQAPCVTFTPFHV